ncbi:MULTISPECIES: DUF1289 domain-containing protein [Halocynthiibacter]|uniref:DUF1289 domain-containing protein n=1 Tax=Halocynthiibacter halioticoli TaxID=2986804 RepID=A0AAE3LSV3_9RHOB|nr:MULTISPECIES: DUF1289 domain-containing protein [Halocynthiibacter]MCV6824021.1 DUF1289 domain-containing protein [Halocynthiibacter halioticoli]MCW4057022.1 DUF1289 domain-containing protein [Halocynthiibacter sp. SDUM655004]MDE0589952.1 DUF1289 domain-containing protein [Halocynthiibacter sp. C4]
MTQEKPPIWKREEPQSPCVNICVIHPAARLCTGCLRSMDEIASWGKMTAEERQDVLDDLPSRAPLLKQRRGGRAGRLRREKP